MTFKSIDFEEGRLPSIMCAELTKALSEKTGFPKKKQFFLQAA